MQKLKASHPRVSNLEVCEDGRLYSMKGELTPSPLPNGYMRVNIKRAGKQSTLLVHRAIAEALLPNPHGKPHVNHKDGDKRNNTLGNLEWVTQSENNQHAWDTGLIKAYTRTREHREVFAAMVRVQPRGARGQCIASHNQQ